MEKLNSIAAADAAVTRGGGTVEESLIHGKYEVQCFGADGALKSLLEDACDALAFQRVLGLVDVDLDIARQAPLAPEIVPGVLERLKQIAGIELQEIGRAHV